MATQTRLSLKLRTLSKDPKHAKDRHRLLFAAQQLDLGFQSLGQNFGRGGMIYYQGRKLYCELTGRKWDWAAEKDLDQVNYDPAEYL